MSRPPDGAPKAAGLAEEPPAAGGAAAGLEGAGAKVGAGCNETQSSVKIHVMALYSKPLMAKCIVWVCVAKLLL